MICKTLSIFTIFVKVNLLRVFSQSHQASCGVLLALSEVFVDKNPMVEKQIKV